MAWCGGQQLERAAVGHHVPIAPYASGRGAEITVEFPQVWLPDLLRGQKSHIFVNGGYLLNKSWRSWLSVRLSSRRSLVETNGLRQAQASFTLDIFINRIFDK
jgi:hypothetical protein